MSVAQLNMFEQLIPRKEMPAAEISPTSMLSRKCSNCGKGGHNSRTCLEIREGTAVASLEQPNEAIDQAAEQHRETQRIAKRLDDSAASEDSANVNHRECRKKGVAWTEEEHRLFLLGLKKLGRGDWRGISRHFVPSRSPTQVASHAQKYFIRQSVAGKRKRRSSLFDLVPDNQEDADATSPHPLSASKKRFDTKVDQAGADTTQSTSQLFASMMQAEAFAMAYYYHTLMAQQGPLAWMQAMCAQPDQPPPLFPYMNQGFVMPGGALQNRFGGPAGAPSGSEILQGPGLALLAQQQLAAAMASGAFPFRPDSLRLSQLPGGPRFPTGPVDAHRAADTSTSAAAGNTRTTDNSAMTKAEPAGKPCFSGRSITETEDHTDSHREPLQEKFGNGCLVRPKAQKASEGHNFGELPTYMQASQDTQSIFISGSAESQSTGARFSLQHLPSSSTKNEASNSTGDHAGTPETGARSSPEDPADLPKEGRSSPASASPVS